MPRVLTPHSPPSAAEAAPAKAARRRFPAWAGWAAAYALFLAYYYSFLDYGLNLWDEGGFAYGTLRTWRGEMAIRDFNPIGYLPGRYVYAAWFFDLFGVSLHSLRLSVAVLTPAMVLMVYAVARRIMPAGFAAMAAAMMLSAPGMYYNRFFPFFCVLILFCLVRWLEAPRPGRALTLAGAILVCVPFKMEISIFSTALALILTPWRVKNEAPGEPAPMRRWTGLGVLAAGLVLVLGYFWRYDIFQKFAAIVLKTHAVWGNPFPDLFPFVFLLKTLGPHVLFERILFYLPLAVYAAVLVRMGVEWMRSPTRAPRQPVLLAITGMGVCAYGLVIWRAGFDNLVRTLPPFYILAAWLLFCGHARLRNLLSPGQNPARGLTPETALAHFLAGLLPLIFLFEMNVTHGFYVGSIGAIRHNTERLQFERLAVWTNPYEARWVRQVVDDIETATRPGDPILALPLNPLFYYLTQRENPIVHDWILPGMLDETARREVVRQLKARMPRLIVLADIPIDGKADRRFARYAPEIDRFIQTYFQLWEQIGLFQIWLPAGSPGNFPSAPPRPPR